MSLGALFFIKSCFSLNSSQCSRFTSVIKSPRAEVLSSMFPSSHIGPVQPDLWCAWTGLQYLSLLHVGQETGRQFFPSISSVLSRKKARLGGCRLRFHMETAPQHSEHQCHALENEATNSSFISLLQRFRQAHVEVGPCDAFEILL